MQEPKAAPPKLSRDEEITRLVRAYIGPNWDRHYSKAWRKLGSAAGVNIGVSWNWAAALLSIAWLAYRKQGRFAFGLLVAFIIAAFYGADLAASLTGTPFAILGLWAVVVIALGCYADVMILQQAYAVAAEAHNEAGASSAVASGVIKSGGVSGANVVRMLVLPLALFALVYFAFLVPYMNAPFKRDEAQMRQYLDQLQTLEEQFRVDSGRYITNPAAFRSIEDSVERVFVPEIVATDSGYHAIVRSDPPLNVECAVASQAPNPISGDSAGGVICRYDRSAAVRTLKKPDGD